MSTAETAAAWLVAKIISSDGVEFLREDGGGDIVEIFRKIPAFIMEFAEAVTAIPHRFCRVKRL